MRLLSLLVPFAAIFQAVVSSPTEDSTGPEILVVGSWPESNPFGHIINGEKNVLMLSIENRSPQKVTLLSVAGAIQHSETNALIKNLTTTTSSALLPEGIKIQVPYTFYSEFKPGDLRLNVWFNYESEGVNYQLAAFDSIITVVEPEVSILDFKMISTYIMILAIFSGAGYLTYVSFAPQAKKVKRSPAVSAPVGNVTATGAGGYQEEWIPDHHIRKNKSKKVGALSSGDELSGGETSGAEGKKRKTKK